MSIDVSSSLSLLAKLRARELTSEAIVRDLLAHSDRLKRLNAFVHLDHDQILAQARNLDSRRESGEELGQLAGIPVAIKDVLCVEGEPTSCASRMLFGFRPPYD